MTKNFLAEHSHGDTFVPTKAYTTAKAMLHQKGAVVVKGSDGDGKTTAAVNLLCGAFDSERCLLITSTSDWQHVDFHLIDAILIDDVLGSGNVDETKLQDWMGTFGVIWSCVVQKNISLVFTICQNILDQCLVRLRKCKLFHSELIVDISSSKLTFSEREQILTRQLLTNKKFLSNDDVNACAEAFDSPLGFPQCCALFASTQEFFQKGVNFFGKPVEFLHDTIETMHESKKHQYFTLVVMMLNGGYTRLESMQFTGKDKKRLHNIAELCGITDITASAIREAANDLAGIYIKHAADDKYTFSHQSILDAVKLSFGKGYPECIVSSCDMDFLLEHVQVSTDDEKSAADETQLTLPEKFYPELAAKFVSEFKAGRIFASAHHSALNNAKFLDKLFQKLSARGVLRDVLRSRDISSGTSLMVCAVDQENPKSEMICRIIQSGKLAKLSRSVWNDEEKDAVLKAVCRRGQYTVYRELVKLGIKVSRHTLIEAATGGNVDILAHVLGEFADCNWTVEELANALYTTCMLGQTETYTALLNMGIDVDEMCLWAAIQGGNTRIVDDLLSRQHVSPNIPDEDGTSPLHMAAAGGNLEMVNKLLRHRANIESANDSGTTPLVMACLCGHFDIVEKLIQAGCDVNSCINTSPTALKIAAETGRADLVKCLLQHGATKALNAQTDEGETALIAASREGHTEVVNLLIKAGADVNIATVKGQTALHKCCEKIHSTYYHVLQNKESGTHQVEELDYKADRMAVAKLLVAKNNSLLHNRDKIGWLPVHASAYLGRYKLTTFFVESGASVATKTKDRDSLADLVKAGKANHDQRGRAVFGYDHGVDFGSEDNYDQLLGFFANA